MAEDERRRRRGRRRGRGSGHQGGEPAEEQPQEDQPDEGDEGDDGDISEESDAPGILPSRLRIGFGRKGEEGGESQRARRQERESHAGAGAHASPLGFWRRGRTRSYRDEPVPKQTLGRTWRRIRGMYFPPWVPVAFIILVVFGILGALFIVRSTAGHPLIGEDHWHASYQVIVCGQRQPNFPTWGGGVHTHADGIIHIHPFRSAEEGAGARLVKWFEYGGGKLTKDEMRMPGTRETYKNGDTCDDGSEAVLQVFVNDQKLDDYTRFIPQDGDRVRIVFGPEEESGPIEQEDRTIIPEDEAARTFEMEITGGEGDAAFSPDSIEIVAGETAKIVVTNNGSISHSLRVAGADGEYETSDDFVATSGEDESDIILPDEQGTVVVRFDEEGEYEFQDPTAPAAQGTITATPVEATPTPTPEEEETPDVDADVTLEVAMGDNFFEPAELEVEAGQTFLIKLTNNGEFVHNMRIAGPDNVFETEDDLVSEPANPNAGQGGTLVGSIDEPGAYDIRSDFQRGEMIGTITVK